MIYRRISENIAQALQVEPVVVLTGARQAGKTTLTKQLLEQGTVEHYVTLDDEFERSRALHEPQNYISDLPMRTVIDEVQRVPELFLPIKFFVDQNRKAGRLLLTGSTDVFAMQNTTGALVGRMRSLTLWPFSQGEIHGVRESFLERAFTSSFTKNHIPVSKRELFESIVTGGFPEAVNRGEQNRVQWLNSYASDLLQRDVRELANIERLHELPQILKLCATRATNMMNYADFAVALGVSQSTLRRYIALLEQVFLISRIPAWYRNLGQRIVKAPKLVFHDTGLMSTLTGLTNPGQLDNSALTGPLLENFVATELLKQISFHESQTIGLYHYRTYRGKEIDLVLEDSERNIVAIEVKASETFSLSDFKNLKEFRDITGSSFVSGILFYSGSETRKISDKIWALPVSALYEVV